MGTAGKLECICNAKCKEFSWPSKSRKSWELDTVLWGQMELFHLLEYTSNILSNDVNASSAKSAKMIDVEILTVEKERQSPVGEKWICE